MGIVSLSVLIILVFLIWFTESLTYKYQVDQLKTQQNLITEGQAILLSQQVFDHNDEGIFLTLTGILANPAIDGASITFSDNSEPFEIGKINDTLKQSFNITYYDDSKDDIVELGAINTFGSTKLLDEVSHQRLSNLVILVLIVLVCIVTVTAIAIRLFVGIPLQRLVSAIEGAALDEAPQVEWKSNDEMGLVVRRLNYLHQTQQQRVEGLRQELDDSERREAERLRNLANASFEGVLIFVDNKILDMNNPMANLLGGDREQLLHRQLDQIFSPEQLSFFSSTISSIERPSQKSTLKNGDNNDVHVEMYIDEMEYGSNAAKVVVVRDITDRMQAEERMRHLALHDGLTGLPNRSHFMDHLSKAMDRAKHQNSKLAVMYVDLDHFKAVNDNHGHAAGDALLQNVSKIIQNNILETGLGARLGGDEFAIIIEGASDLESEAEILANRLLNDLVKCRDDRSVGSKFGASIGIAIYADKQLPQSDLLAQADSALYQAKELGRNTFKTYTGELDQDNKRYNILVERLKTALDEDQLELYFQPTVNTKTQQITCLEALLRWSDATVGNVSPNQMIACAHKEGFTPKLFTWILSNACNEAASWEQPYRISVNLSPRELEIDGLVNIVDTILQSSGLPAARLEIEITEKSLISDTQQTCSTINELKALGIAITLDDFATENSSLSYLQQIPFDRIKIDPSFTDNIDNDEASASIVSLIIGLGQKLQLDVVAEGVETKAQLELLSNQNCTEVQGCYIHQPIPQSQLAAYLSKLTPPMRRAS